jgi:ABC-type nitrate/sulfonate/bicarbonate transport system substrate-binding protein
MEPLSMVKADADGGPEIMTITIPRSSALALAAAALAAPGRAWAQTSASAIRIGTSPASTQAEAYYAEQLGFFKQAGITTTQTFVTRSTDTLAAIIRGDLDIGLTSPQAIANAIIHGVPIQIIATAAVFAGNPPPTQLFVPKGSALG